MAKGRVDQYGQHTDNYPASLRYAQIAHEFEMHGHKYACNGLAPLEQIHLARRLAPIVLGALKPEGGRQAILARLLKLAGLANTEGGKESGLASNEQVIADALDLATSIFAAAAATDEEAVNIIIRKSMLKIFRKGESGGVMVCWDNKNDMPVQRDIDGFKTMGLVSMYLFLEFKDVIAEHLSALNLKPGPALMAAAGMRQHPPGAPAGQGRPSSPIFNPGV